MRIRPEIDRLMLSRTSGSLVPRLPLLVSGRDGVRSRWCGIDVVDVPRGGPDGCANPQGVVLATDEHLEVVVNDGLGQGGEPTVAS
jgi:hypothetical protein